jgi:hypothetical protein
MTGRPDTSRHATYQQRSHAGLRSAHWWRRRRCGRRPPARAMAYGRYRGRRVAGVVTLRHWSRVVWAGCVIRAQVAEVGVPLGPGETTATLLEMNPAQPPPVADRYFALGPTGYCIEPGCAPGDVGLVGAPGSSFPGVSTQLVHHLDSGTTIIVQANTDGPVSGAAQDIAGSGHARGRRGDSVNKIDPVARHRVSHSPSQQTPAGGERPAGQPRQRLWVVIGLYDRVERGEFERSAEWRRWAHTYGIAPNGPAGWPVGSAGDRNIWRWCGRSDRGCADVPASTRTGLGNRCASRPPTPGR